MPVRTSEPLPPVEPSTPRPGGAPELYRKLRLCSNGGGVEAIPDRPVSLDLAAVRRTLEQNGIPVVDARVLLIASMDPEVTISRAGRLLFKTGETELADRAFERLRSLIDFEAFTTSRGSQVRSS